MTDAIKGLKPEPVWRFFSEIAEIPRESKNEARMTQYILDVAARHGLQAQRDDVGNVVVRKPAAPGKEKAPAVVLQGHLDMVCEKNKDKKFDFARDPIQLVRAGEYMQADGTTLGSDNGIGLAMSLAVMTDKSLPYGPLEMLCTVDEETGLTGANALKPDFVKGRMLLNLDSEEEGTVYVGCAGGKDTVGKFRPAWEEAPGGFVPMEVRITGLKGGHSGLDIALGRANSLEPGQEHGAAARKNGRRKQAKRHPARGGGGGPHPAGQDGRGKADCGPFRKSLPE
jgi:dipeptidase D